MMGQFRCPVLGVKRRMFKRSESTRLTHTGLAQIEAMIADFDGMAATLENEIEAEETRTGIRDLAHIAYSILAKATIVRRDNLRRTVTDLKDELTVAMALPRRRSIDNNKNHACRFYAVTFTPS
jgi:hypothetical protein